MSLIDKIRERQANEDRIVIEVPDWDSTIYAHRVTVGDIDKVARKHPGFPTSPSVAAMVETIILKAEDEKGDRHFTIEHKPLLMREPVDIVAQIFAAIFTQRPVEDYEKNSEATHSD